MLLTIWKNLGSSQLLQFEVEFDCVKVIKTFSILPIGSDIQAVAIVLYGIEPRPDIHDIRISVVVHRLNDGFGHQSRHIVQIGLGSTWGCYQVSCGIEHAKSSCCRVSLEVI